METTTLKNEVNKAIDMDSMVKMLSNKGMLKQSKVYKIISEAVNITIYKLLENPEFLKALLTLQENIIAITPSDHKPINGIAATFLNEAEKNTKIRLLKSLIKDLENKNC